MFERYTEHARRAIFLARYEASQFGAPFIEPEHFLVGLLREDPALLQHLTGAKLAELRKEAGDLVELTSPAPRERVSTSRDLPLSPALKAALAYAAEEAGTLRVDTPHLLLGLLRAPDSPVPELLGKYGVARDAVLSGFAEEPSPAADPGEAPAIERRGELKAVRRVIERLSLGDDGKTLSYTQEIAGPGKSLRHTVDFDVS